MAEIRRSFDWALEPHFLAYATRLDRTNIFYFQPEVYRGVETLWGVSGPKFWPAYTSDDKLFWVVGMYRGRQPVGPFWDDKADFERLLASNLMYSPQMPHVCDLFSFAKAIQPHINTSHFACAMQEAIRYHALHRCVVRRVGRITGVDMDDHDLTKSRIVHVALAYAHHWGGIPHEKRLLTAANLAIKGGHTECESHHLEYDDIVFGGVDVSKLIVDRLSVHLQKDTVDKEKGWGVDPKWIPEEYTNYWDEFKNKHKHNDLYEECLWKARNETKRDGVRDDCAM